MNVLELNVSVRTETGKKAAKKFRKNESVPCVLYGGKENVNLVITEREVRQLIFTPKVYLLKLNVEGTEKSYNAILQEIQYHPLSDKPLHIDFFEISDSKKITMKVPVQLEGFAAGVKAGGKLVQTKRLLAVKSLPKDMPDNLTVDVTELGLGKSLRVGDLNFPDMELMDIKNDVVAAVRATRTSKGNEGAAENPAANAAS